MFVGGRVVEERVCLWRHCGASGSPACREGLCEGGDGDGDLDADADVDEADDCPQPGAELCNGLDDDCDPTTPDGEDEPGLGVPCDGDDDDLCEEGTLRCIAGAVACDDTTGDTIEECNGWDDDCDGAIDNGGGCPCDLKAFDGHAYLFCPAASWPEARSFCAGLGYWLVTIEEEEENAFVSLEAFVISPGRAWWIGLNDIAEEGTFVWDQTGLPPAYTNWGSSQPDDYDSNEDCCELNYLTDPALWNDNECTNARHFVCEAG
jgi:hypothetical protein